MAPAAIASATATMTTAFGGFAGKRTMLGVAAMWPPWGLGLSAHSELRQTGEVTMAQTATFRLLPCGASILSGRVPCSRKMTQATARQTDFHEETTGAPPLPGPKAPRSRPESKSPHAAGGGAGGAEGRITRQAAGTDASQISFSSWR